MSAGGKITDARMAELRAKIEHRDSLKEKLEQQREAMDELRIKIAEAKVEEQLNSSSAAARIKRGIPLKSITMGEELQVMQLAIDRLERRMPTPSKNWRISRR